MAFHNLPTIVRVDVGLSGYDAHGGGYIDAFEESVIGFFKGRPKIGATVAYGQRDLRCWLGRGG